MQPELREGEALEAQWDAVGEAAELLTAALRVVEEARSVFELAAVANEGDPWYAEHEGIDAEAVLAAFRDALAEWDALVERKP